MAKKNKFIKGEQKPHIEVLRGEGRFAAHYRGVYGFGDSRVEALRILRRKLMGPALTLKQLQELNLQ